jgi:ribosome maturation factor RimP
MDKYELEAKIKSMVEGYLAGENAELVELIVRRQGRDIFVKVLADKVSSDISVGECARINSRLTTAIDEEGIFPEGYILEVSSPGLDRPLTTRQDFVRCRGRHVTAFLKEPLAGRFEYTGTIEQVQEESVDIMTGGQVVNIPLSIISKAKQIISLHTTETDT